MKRQVLWLFILCTAFFMKTTSTFAGVTCTLTCPANITVSNDQNQCGAIVTFNPTGSNCGVITSTPPSGSFFPVGTTTVNVTTDATMTCDFTVTVNDTQPPTITCPGNISQLVPGPTVVTFPAPTASDNCPAPTVACVPPSGSTFSLGTTTDSCTATDTSGNTAACTFDVTLTVPADLSVIKSDTPDPVMAGNNLTYTIEVTNNGPADAQNLTFTDVIPADTSFVSFTAPAGWTGVSVPPVGGTGTVMATLATLANGDTDTFTLEVMVNPATPDDTLLSNTGNIISETPDDDTSNNSSTATTSVGLPQITIDDVTVTEGDSGTVDACFTVTLSKPSTDIVTVDLATADDTAVAPDDYVSDSGPVSFPAGEISSEACITVNSDLLEESDETFFVSMSNPTNAVIGDDQGLGTILDDDGAIPPPVVPPPVVPPVAPPADEIEGSGCILAKNANRNNLGVPIFAFSSLFLAVGTLAARRKNS